MPSTPNNHHQESCNNWCFYNNFFCLSFSLVLFLFSFHFCSERERKRVRSGKDRKCSIYAVYIMLSGFCWTLHLQFSFSRHRCLSSVSQSTSRRVVWSKSYPGNRQIHERVRETPLDLSLIFTTKLVTPKQGRYTDWERWSFKDFKSSAESEKCKVSRLLGQDTRKSGASEFFPDGKSRTLKNQMKSKNTYQWTTSMTMEQRKSLRYNGAVCLRTWKQII